ncbi:MAG: hypothetical protein OEW04_06695 [Nitrospirota bacterium]|nr:hypothetical protein [Nitrospirota bacterium]
MDQITEKSDLKEIRERILEIKKEQHDILRRLEHISRVVEDIHREVKGREGKEHD